MTSLFTQRVLSIVRRIPRGRVASYGEVAALAGRPGAARAVGNIMRLAPVPGLPYHRVIAAGGRLGGYGGHEDLKRALLLAEGVPVSGSRVRDVGTVSIAATRSPRAATGSSSAPARSRRPGR